MRLRVQGDGPLVVKVAGLAAGVGLYHEEVGRARASGFRVAELDTTGDRADDPAATPITWKMLADEVIEALDRLEAERAVLWGTSFGSLVSLAAAARHPDRIRGLLLCSPPEPGWRPRPYLRVLEFTSSRRRPARVTARWFSIGFLILNSWEFINPLALVRLPGLARASRDARTPATTILDKLVLLLRDEPGLPDPDGRMPCSIISGMFDTVTSPGASRRLARKLPGSRLYRLPFAGHSCAYSRPRAYAERTLGELRRLAAG